ncbi:MAG: UDP-3-O-acyl-N-acetylglucosamine deacetylase [Phycisphaerales bacterium]|nr:UDP-3-O-acyl-N-acetylglucosamine deacetylase [Phycisphaerales bacterium]MCI0674379.1 UDP-3-O-acyl-N-acetylglucosamine deacetylase [Phycisphaerales bacterium]
MLQTLTESKPDVASLPRQHTLAGPASLEGRGLLLGEPVGVVIKPAPVNHGIEFVRVDLNPPVHIPAIAANVAERARRTTLRIGAATIETVEHCMSAFAGLRIDNAIVEINGPELPCGDGSAAPFVDPILQAGLVEQDAPRRIFRVTDPIIVEEGDAMLAAFPCQDDEFKLVFDLDYGAHSNRIKRQTQAFEFNNGNYVHDLARARTYSLREEAQALWDRGMCRHLTPRDVLVIGDEGPIDNAYRFENEPVRHKIVDLLGDLYLIGGEVYGRFMAHKSGHSLNRRMCLKILEQAQTQRRRDLVNRGRELDIRSILRIMPHRYPMLLVDRVVEIDGDRKATGIKNVTINEPFFEGHYPGTPIMPGVLLVEAMAQLGGLLMSRKLEHTGKIAVLLSLDKVKLRRPVTPGDQVILEAEAVQAKTKTGTLKCRAFVGGKLAAEAQIRFMMVDAELE